MMRSLFSGVSGLRNHQTRMDVIGNNIANVNTIGFKGSRVNFHDVLSQTIQGASSANGNRGGTNPMQVGLGVGVASIDTIFTDGSFQPTGKQTDLSIQGQGFFVLSNGSSQIYTRAGNFDFDEAGNYLVPGTGYRVMGWMADANGNINTASDIQAIQLPVGVTMDPKQTKNITLAGNLSGSSATDRAPLGSTYQTSIGVYDSKGIQHKVSQTFLKTGDNTWLMSVSVPDAVGTVTGSQKEVTFNPDGTFKSVKDLTSPGATTTLAVTAPFKLNSTTGSVETKSITIMDTNGKPHVLQIKFTNTDTPSTPAGTHDWSYAITEPSNPALGTISGTVNYTGGNYTFTPANFAYAPIAGNFTLGTIAGVAPDGLAGVFNQTVPYGTAAPTSIGFTATGGGNPMTINMDVTGLNGYGNASDAGAKEQDGWGAGTLESTSIDTNGVIVGKFTNGRSRSLGQVALATFNNPAGLMKAGENLYVESTNSGVAQVGPSGTGGRGRFSPGTLEMSNVDLSQEFSNMIITQRGFQANSKIITTTDEMLQELANLKR